MKPYITYEIHLNLLTFMEKEHMSEMNAYIIIEAVCKIAEDETVLPIFA